MKRFITVFATLILGATLFSTAMAQGKPDASTGTHKKHVAMHKVKKAVHHHRLMAKKKIAHKMATHKVALKTSRKGTSHPASKPKARRPMAQPGRSRTTHGSTIKAGGKRSPQIGRTPIRSLNRTRPLNNGAIKSKSAPKAGKVVNRR